jgi:radical SAM superfamily enzyme YgiQ (UPF0313 family)
VCKRELRCRQSFVKSIRCDERDLGWTGESRLFRRGLGDALQHADAVVVGEAEPVWSQVLADAVNGTLRGIYRGRPQRTQRTLSWLPTALTFESPS